MPERKQVILYLIATNKYHVFVQPLLKSVDEYFLVDHDLTVILFTDNIYRKFEFNRDIVYVGIPSYRFPAATLFRFKIVTEHKELFQKSDAIYYLDIDMLIVAPVGDEVLPIGEGLVSTVHPGFYNGGWGSNNTHQKSLAYVPEEQRTSYYCGGFQAGSTESYLMMAKELSENIDKDMQTAKEIGYLDNGGILSEYHDETHYNWYLKNRNTDGSWLILDSSYCYPESWNIPFEKKILALDKNHAEIRS